MYEKRTSKKIGDYGSEIEKAEYSSDESDEENDKANQQSKKSTNDATNLQYIRHGDLRTVLIMLII